MAVIPIILLNGTTADANDVMADFTEIYTNITNVNIANAAGISFSKLEDLNSAQILVGSVANVPTPRTMSGAGTLSNTGVLTLSSGGTGGTLPIGSIIPFYDFNAMVTFDNTYFVYCDGTVIANGLSPLNGQTLPDLSGRALVGFGTDGGGDIGTAAWATAAVGNPGNVINLLHSHTVNPHQHDMQNHTHDHNHTHGPGSFVFEIFSYNGTGTGNNINGFNSGGGAQVIGVSRGNAAGVGATTFGLENASITAYTNNGSGTSGAPSSVTTSGPSTNNTSNASPGTDNQLSTTQSIQPISIRVRFIMRIV